MKKKIVLFDLDGTVTDPGLGITNSVIYSLKKFGIEPPERKELYAFIGPPLYESFQKYFGMSLNQSIVAVDYYREYYKPHGIFECHLYDGLREVLELIKQKGATAALATSKPEIFARQLVSHFGLDGLIKEVAGSELDGTRIDKAEVIKRAFSLLGEPDPESVVMIGDREHDIIGAKKCGISSIGAAYGYGSISELEEAGADMIAKDTGELYGILEKIL